MMGIKTSVKCAALILVFGWQIFQSQIKVDTLDKWMSGFASYHNLRLSEKSNWMMVTKSYTSNSDTLLILKTDSLENPKHTLVKMNLQQKFLGETALLAQGSNTAQYIGLKGNKKISYSNVKKAEVLEGRKNYLLLDNDHNLIFYDYHGNKISEIADVTDFVSDRKSQVAATVREGNINKIMNMSARSEKVLFETPNKITFTNETFGGSLFFFTETDPISGRIKPSVINPQTGTVLFPLGDRFFTAEKVKISEMRNGGAFLFDLVHWEGPGKDKMVELWYGNDEYLRLKNKSVEMNDYWLWNPEKREAVPIENKDFTDYIAINSDRFFLAFNNAEQFNYIYSTPVYALYLHDRITGISQKIVDGTRDTSISSDGKLILMFNEIKKRWELFDREKNVKIVINQPGIGEPLFWGSSLILFESNKGLHLFNLHTNRFEKVLLNDKKTTIMNRTFSHQENKRKVSFKTNADPQFQKIVVRAQDTLTNTNSFYKWDGQKLEELLLNTENRINEIQVPDAKPFLITIEENFNRRPQVYIHKKNRIKDSVIASTSYLSEDHIKREIIMYENSKGRVLKGILFYPVRFDSLKKYPMVVKIYQNQGALSTTYLKPMYSEDGSNIRLLIEKGYLVFLPDTVVDDRGPGIAALDCVHSALDALKKLSYINHDKVGLVGHSFGGYETNFIATHSDRFAAFISGSSVSHLTSRYYMNNPTYEYLEYSKIENSQYAMEISFSQAKKKYIENNPIYFAEQIKAPILLWAGMKDRNVTPDQTLAFYIALLREKKDVITLTYANQGHAFDSGSAEAKDLTMRSIEWWDYFLKDKKEVFWISKQLEKDAL